EEPEVHTVNGVPQEIREQGLHPVRSEAREERPDADANRREERPDQERHPEGGADDPQHEAPEDSFDEVVDDRGLDPTLSGRNHARQRGRRVARRPWPLLRHPRDRLFPRLGEPDAVGDTPRGTRSARPKAPPGGNDQRPEVETVPPANAPAGEVPDRRRLPRTRTRTGPRARRLPRGRPPGDGRNPRSARG